MAADTDRIKKRFHNLRDRLKQRDPIARVLLALLGLIIFLGGLVMLITPGPALVAVPLGLALLSLVFDPLVKVLDRMIELIDRAENISPKAWLAIAAITVVAVAAILYVWVL